MRRILYMAMASMFVVLRVNAEEATDKNRITAMALPLVVLDAGTLGDGGSQILSIMDKHNKHHGLVTDYRLGSKTRGAIYYGRYDKIANRLTKGELRCLKKVLNRWLESQENKKSEFRKVVLEFRGNVEKEMNRIGKRTPPKKPSGEKTTETMEKVEKKRPK